MTKGEPSFSDRPVKQNLWDHVITTPCSNEQELKPTRPVLLTGATSWNSRILIVGSQRASVDPSRPCFERSDTAPLDRFKDLSKSSGGKQ
jgi:hypothetical protein